MQAGASRIFKAGTNLLNVLKPSVTVDSLTPFISIGGVRHKRQQYNNRVAKAVNPDGIPYHGFTYYPRSPDQKDPPIEPSKLLMVKQIKSVKGHPHWEKYMVHSLGMRKVGDVIIVKNSPESNQKLYRIKNLIEIHPITFPYGEPTEAGQGYLDDHGRYINYRLIGDKPEEEVQTHHQEMMKNSVDGETVRSRCRLRWLGRWEVI